MANKKTAKIMIILGCCCIVAAAAFYTYNRWVSSRAAAASAELTGTLSALIEASENPAPDDGGTDPLLVEPDGAAVPASADASEEPTVNVNGYDISGILSLPTLDIDLAVISEWSYPNLKVSACRYSGTPSGQLVILAHNYKQHFGRIGELQLQDSVIFTDPNGTEYNYEVTGIEIKGKNELPDIVSGDWDLTLFTCTYGGENRVVVRCKLSGQ
jgi:sortase A